MIKVSIIVPVYNTEKYIQKCLDSLVNQTYKNIEIIIVNDGSIDKSEKIINDYKKKYKPIKYIYQKNSGAFLARLNGIKNSTGDYLMFVDSDDYILNETVENLVKILNETKVDILKFNYLNYNSGAISNYYKNDIEKLKKLLLTTTKLNNLSNEIVSKKIVNYDDNLEAIKSSNGEDLLMNLYFYDKAKTIKIIDDKYYYYTINESSTTNVTLDWNKAIKFINEYNVLLSTLMHFAKKWNMEEQEVIDKIYFRNIKGIAIQISKIIVQKPSNYEQINDCVDNIKISTEKIKKIIKSNESNLLNKKIYISIYSKKYKKASFLLNLKKVLKKLKK